MFQFVIVTGTETAIIRTFVQYILLGDAWVRDDGGRAIGWKGKGEKVSAECQPGAVRCELQGGGTVLGACLIGPKAECK